MDLKGFEWIWMPFGQGVNISSQGVTIGSQGVTISSLGQAGRGLRLQIVKKSTFGAPELQKADKINAFGHPRFQNLVKTMVLGH